MKNRVSGVNQKHYTQYNFQDHIWNMTTPANKYMLELAERCVKIDGMYFKGTGNKLNAEKHYNDIINDPSIIKTKENILQSQEIDVPLEEQNN